MILAVMRKKIKPSLEKAKRLEEIQSQVLTMIQMFQKLRFDSELIN